MATIIDIDRLPPFFPTHRHSPEFWEKLGRAVATYSFLEEILRKGIFALEFTKQYESEEERNIAYEKWKKQGKKNLSAQLYNLANSFQTATIGHQDYNDDQEEISKLINFIKESAKLRNILCHGAWMPPNEEGKSVPLFINRDLEKFETGIDINYLEQIQEHNKELICHVINWITNKGYQFPGWNNPGKNII